MTARVRGVTACFPWLVAVERAAPAGGAGTVVGFAYGSHVQHALGVPLERQRVRVRQTRLPDQGLGPGTVSGHLACEGCVRVCRFCVRYDVLLPKLRAQGIVLAVATITIPTKPASRCTRSTASGPAASEFDFARFLWLNSLMLQLPRPGLQIWQVVAGRLLVFAPSTAGRGAVRTCYDTPGTATLLSRL